MTNGALGKLIPFAMALWALTLSPIAAEPDFKALRYEMVERQLIARGIKDQKVLQAMKKVPRHLFVPEKYRLFAYTDGPLPIGQGQTISQPYIVALMTEALLLKPHSRVLEIGTGSGYQAAVLAEIVKEVYTIEIISSLANRAEALLNRLGYENIFVRIGDGYKGWPEKAPFDAIIVTCAPERIPRPLVEQLKEGGRIVIPVGPQNSVQKLVVGTKAGGRIEVKTLVAVRFVPMIRKKE